MLKQAKCPECSGEVEASDSLSVGQSIALLFCADILTYSIAGALTLLGMYWSPAYVIALLFVTWAFITKTKTLYCCKACGNKYTYNELYKRKNF